MGWEAAGSAGLTRALRRQLRAVSPRHGRIPLNPTPNRGAEFNAVAVMEHDAATTLQPGYGGVSGRVARVDLPCYGSDRGTPSVKHLHDLRLEARTIDGAKPKFGAVLQDPANWT